MNSVLRIPERIVSDFGGKAQPTREGVRALAAAISTAANHALQTSLEQWTVLFRKTCGQDWPRPKAGLDRLARHYGVPHDPAQPQRVLFALQSWYVLLVKLLVRHVVAACRVGFSRLRNERLADDDPGRTRHVRKMIESIESGDLFSALGVTDPWCGEPFGWAVSAWSPALEWALVQAAARIARYDPLAIIAHAAGGGDLLKPLYESLFPRAVRHALGEYYTPTGWPSTCSIRSVTTDKPKPACSTPPAAPGRSCWPPCGAGGKAAGTRRVPSAPQFQLQALSEARTSWRTAQGLCLLPWRTARPHPSSSALTCIRLPWPRRGRTISWRSRTSWGRKRHSRCRSSRAMRSSIKAGTKPRLILSSAIRPGSPGTTCPSIIARPPSRTGSVTACSRFPATRHGMAAARRTSRCSCSTRPPIAIWGPPGGWAW